MNRRTASRVQWVFLHAGGSLIETPDLPIPQRESADAFRWVATLWRDRTSPMHGQHSCGTRPIAAGGYRTSWPRRRRRVRRTWPTRSEVVTCPDGAAGSNGPRHMGSSWSGHSTIPSAPSSTPDRRSTSFALQLHLRGRPTTGRGVPDSSPLSRTGTPRDLEPGRERTIDADRRWRRTASSGSAESSSDVGVVTWLGASWPPCSPEAPSAEVWGSGSS